MFLCQVQQIDVRNIAVRNAVGFDIGLEYLLPIEKKTLIYRD
jgi:hypothetical protein